ncbi:PD-(D/E)XK nuclease family protein [Pelagibius sp. 7325]|uniref:PD-(D/E)XK nuclease family protein n=1 Tax=Pelagibius sp. 7325 TaxID=3131994 RepID=UPI0030EC3C26
MREMRLKSARHRDHGVQVMTFEQLAVRLAGGFCQPIDEETLRAAVQACLAEADLGELDGIKTLPGMIGAAVGTLHKAWRAGVDLQARAGDQPRLASIAQLEAAVLGTLPPSMLRPTDIVAAGMQRLDHAEALFGPVEIVGITELSPCWRPLLHALAAKVPIRWVAGPRETPSWLDGKMVEVVQTEAKTPAVETVSASTAYHEAIEALRWARRLIATGQAAPGEVAIASVTPAEYDDYFLALRSDANLDLHFVHGVPVTACREGQAAAALADILVRGISQNRMRRLVALVGDGGELFKALPEGWTRVLPNDAPLASVEAWDRLADRLTAEDWPDGADHTPALRALIAQLGEGVGVAEKVGQQLLTGRALKIWKKALAAGPAASLDQTLETLKEDDGLEACVSMAWMPASALAASPRPFVRLLGLNSARWPRPITDDRLLSDHIIPSAELDPLPISAADRRDFRTILATTEHQVVLSRARRDSDGRLLGRSPLLQGQPEEGYLRRNRVPPHAYSETDRLMARPEEFRALPQALSAACCWRDWWRNELTPHDGLVRADHPVLQSILERTQSASSLRRLLRNPLGFVWQYGLRLREPESGEDPLVLDALAMGNLVHMTLEQALRRLESADGLANATAAQIASAIDVAAEDVALSWEMEHAVPPPVIWRRTLDDVRAMGAQALTFDDEPLPDARSFAEVPFGGLEPAAEAEMPWDASVPVEIPGTGFRINGYIDRLDIDGNGQRALVRDYKTGKAPRNDITLDGGRELQRCLYAFAVKALLGEQVEVSASLLYLRDEVDLQLADPEATLATIREALRAARASLMAGSGVLGPDTGGRYDDLAFALPANAGATYSKIKIPAAKAQLGPAAEIWEAP